MSVKGCTIFGGTQGEWQVLSQKIIAGEGLPLVSHLHVGALEDSAWDHSAWKLRGVISNVRYVEKSERVALVAKQEGLGRPTANYGALLPIKKTQAWWDLTQDERRDIFEDQSKHIEANMKYLPNIARQLYHSRDLGEEFDFLTWFEYRAEDSDMFDEMIQAFRETVEWKYVQREIDFRLLKK